MYAAGERLGSIKPQSVQAHLYDFFHHTSPAMVLLRKPLFELAKCQLPRTLEWYKI